MSSTPSRRRVYITRVNQALQNTSDTNYFLLNPPSYEEFCLLRDQVYHSRQASRDPSRQSQSFLRIQASFNRFLRSAVFEDWLTENAEQLFADNTVGAGSSRDFDPLSPFTPVGGEGSANPAYSPGEQLSPGFLPPVVPFVLPLSIMGTPATFDNCRHFLRVVTSPKLVPGNTLYTANALSAADEERLEKVKADKLAKSVLTGDRPRLKLEGNIKSQHWEEFYRIFTTILADNCDLFSLLVDLSFDQHASASAVNDAIAASGGPVLRYPGAGANEQVGNDEPFRLNAKANRKIYATLLLLTNGHASEIVKRVVDMDGRRALFSLRADALKQTDGQVIALQQQIANFKVPANKSPSSSLDTLWGLCKELHTLLTSKGSSYGDVQVKAAIVHALPEAYQQFCVVRDQRDTSDETVESLLTQISNYHVTYLNKDTAKAATAPTKQKSGGDAKPPSEKEKAKAKKLGKAEKAKKAKAAKAKEAAKASNASNDNTFQGECVICKNVNPGAAGNNHPFAECPLLKKVKNLGSSASRTVRTVTTSDDDSDDEQKVSAVSVKGKGKATRFNVPRG